MDTPEKDNQTVIDNEPDVSYLFALTALLLKKVGTVILSMAELKPLIEDPTTYNIDCVVDEREGTVTARFIDNAPPKTNIYLN